MPAAEPRSVTKSIPPEPFTANTTASCVSQTKSGNSLALLSPFALLDLMRPVADNFITRTKERLSGPHSPMITVTREHKNGVTSIKLSGSIDEHVDLPKEIGAMPAQVNILCREITQINSLGVKAWIDFFTRAAGAKIKFTYSECPPPIVEQLNYITNFSCGGQVLSVSVPFTCESCHKELRGVVRSEDLRKVAYKLPPIKCPKCGAKAVFDDVPEEYFAFLIRQQTA